MRDGECREPGIHAPIPMDPVAGAEPGKHAIMIRGLSDTRPVQRRKESDGCFHGRRRQRSQWARGQTQEGCKGQRVDSEDFPRIRLGLHPMADRSVPREFRTEGVQEEVSIREDHFFPCGMGNFSATRST